MVDVESLVSEARPSVDMFTVSLMTALVQQSKICRHSANDKLTLKKV